MSGCSSCKADAVIAHAKALLARLSLEFFPIARAVFGQAVDRLKNIHGDVLRDGAEAGFGFLGNRIRFNRRGPCGRRRGSDPW
jgi:hypothetical protein